MRVSVVIPHYFEERNDNLPVLVEALRSGSVQPDEILIWNNGAPLPPIPHASVMQSHRNVGCQGRFLAALAADADLVVFQDNDVMVESQTLEGLLYWNDRIPHAIISADGRGVVSGVSYRHWSRVRGLSVTAPTLVDVSVGRLEAVSRALLPKILATFPFQPDTVMDDLWFSAGATTAKVPIFVVPCQPGAALRNLNTHGVGMSVKDKGTHYAERTRVWSEIQERQHVA